MDGVKVLQNLRRRSFRDARRPSSMVASGARTGPVSLDEQGSPTSRPAARCSRHRAGLHSVTLLGSVWTLHHPIERHQPKLRSANKQVEHGHRRRDLAPTSSMALMLQKSQPRTGHTRNGRMTWKRSSEEKPHTDASQGTRTHLGRQSGAGTSRVMSGI